MRILITNDDGILAPGIQALYSAVADLGDVDVVAPETPQSAIGHAISVLTPMSVHRIHVNGTFHGWSVDGRPADCIKLALLALLEQRPDFVLSGINAGANTGNNVLYSGTVAGAAEAAFFGVPSLAISLDLSDELNFALAARIARDVFTHFAASKPPPATCLNVNIPALDKGTPRGVRCCPQSTMCMQEHYYKTTDETGRIVFWLDGRFPEHHDCPSGDLAALRDGYVTVTPLRFDLTHHELLPQVAEWSWPARFD
jgi:5'-nucleotidase